MNFICHHHHWCCWFSFEWFVRLTSFKRIVEKSLHSVTTNTNSTSEHNTHIMLRKLTSTYNTQRVNTSINGLKGIIIPINYWIICGYLFTYLRLSIGLSVCLFRCLSVYLSPFIQPSLSFSSIWFNSIQLYIQHNKHIVHLEIVNWKVK